MSDYDFKSLTDKDFEVFCADLLGDVEGSRFERFKPGKDSGIDGRYFKDSKEVVLQCKHWANTPIDQLIKRLAKDEAPKVRKLRPARYLLAISNPLSRANKAAIAAAYSPYVLNPSDIYGKEDLNDLLRPRPAVAQRHYKLWLSSAAVLTHMFNKAIFDRSAASIEEAQLAINKYVVTDHHQNALQKLEELGVLIITGEPGIGKTTLAEHMCLTYVASEFQLLKIARDIREAEAAFDPDQKQLFYFDDFLGRNYLEALTGHEGSHIVQFIRRVLRQKNKRFILTSRSTILNQGKLLIDSFRHQNLDQNEYQLVVTRLSEMDRARILYNHIWHSNLQIEFVDELYVDKRYRNVVNHRNYNPRLIGFITDSSRVTESPAEYWPFIVRQLDNPSEVWDNPFIAQQDDYGRCIVLLVALNRRPISEGDLADAYSRYVSYPVNAGMHGRRDFLSTTRQLTGSLLKRKVDRQNITYDLFNPSIGDYVLRRYTSDHPTLRLAFCSLRTYSSLDTLHQLYTTKWVTQSTYSGMLHSILKEALSEKLAGYSAEYLSTVVNRLRAAGDNLAETDTSVFATIVRQVASQAVPRMFDECAILLTCAIRAGVIDSKAALKYVMEAAGQNPSFDELKSLDALLFELASDETEAEKEAAEELLLKLILEYIEENLSDDVDSQDALSGIAYGDYETAEERVLDIVHRQLADFHLAIDSSIANDIVGGSDFRSWAENKFEPPEYDDEPTLYRPTASTFTPPTDPVEDLFDRS
jgi:adenylate kinase family enzyme